MFLTIKFILDCNTLTRLERTSSSWVHCSNEAGWTGELWGSDDSKWLPLGVLRVGIPAVPEFLGCAGGTRGIPKIPGSVTRRIFPPNSSAEHQGYHEVFRPGAEKGEGAVATRYPPLERINSMCKRKRARG